MSDWHHWIPFVAMLVYLGCGFLAGYVVGVESTRARLYAILGISEDDE